VELRPWTLPNFLTFARLVALPFLVMAILGGRAWAALAIFLAAAVTDIVDGYVARRFAMGSPLGALLDPIADTIFRDVFILVICLVLFLALEIRSFPPSILGKLTTFLEVSTVTAILLANVQRIDPVVATVCMWLVAAFTIASGLHYSWRVLTQLPRGPHQPAARPAA
jgi:cardiolipin synthase